MTNFLSAPENRPGAEAARGDLDPEQEQQMQDIFGASSFKQAPGDVSLPENATVPGQSAAQDPNAPAIVAQPAVRPQLPDMGPRTEDLPSLMEGFKKALGLRLNGDIEGYTKTLHQILHMHAPDVDMKQFEDLRFGDAGTVQDMIGAYMKDKAVVGQKLEDHYQKLFGPEGQVASLQRATQSANKWVQDAEAWAHYGMAPDEVAALQKQTQSDNPGERAEANRRLVQAQEKAMDPGDPARIWNNMDSFHQASFLMGNAMSQLGMSLMHISGQTPMDLLNKLMDADYQKQKDAFARRQGNLKSAYDAYSYVAQQTQDLAARENLAKMLMITPLEIHAHAIGLADTAQKLHEVKAQRLQQAIFQKFHEDVDLKKEQFAAMGSHLALAQKLFASQEQKEKPLPPGELDKVMQGVHASSVLGQAHDDLTEGNTSLVGKYAKSLKSRAAEVAGSIERRGGGRQAIEGEENLMNVGTLERKTRAQDRMQEQALEEITMAEEKLDALEGAGYSAAQIATARQKLKEERIKWQQRGSGHGGSQEKDVELK